MAGSTHRTTQVAKTIFGDNRFKITHIITPQPRKVGRKQEKVVNPLNQFADENQIETTLVNKKIDSEIKEKLESLKKPDILMVVDFGFWLPEWLLNLPKKAPLNIHPSLLPKWRGSSPGQNVLLHGDKDSAVTLMMMIKKMDAGPILVQLPFEVNQSWNQEEYYQYSFDLICQNLGDHIADFIEGKIKPVEQPIESPTPLAEKITKEQAFIEWNEIKNAIEQGKSANKIERACRAFYPWPKLWTKINTSKGEKRMIIHQCSTDQGKLVLKKVQLEGKKPSSWNEIKNNID